MLRADVAALMAFYDVYEVTERPIQIQDVCRGVTSDEW
jgi:hypothetical protein